MHGWTTQLIALGLDQGGAQGRPGGTGPQEVPLTEDLLRRLREAGL